MFKRDVEFNSFIEHELPVGEVNDGKSKVETAGYIPAEVRIGQMIDAGMRLRQSRAEMFDVPPGMDVDIDDVAIDPTRIGNFDMADADRLLSMVKPKVVDPVIEEVPEAKPVEAK